MLFTIMESEKTPFYAIKARSSKSRKIDIFPKRLIHGFGPKMTIFPSFLFLRKYRPGKWIFFQLFFFLKNRPGKSLLRYSRAKKRLSRL